MNNWNERKRNLFWIGQLESAPWRVLSFCCCRWCWWWRRRWATRRRRRHRRRRRRRPPESWPRPASTRAASWTPWTTSSTASPASGTPPNNSVMSLNSVSLTWDSVQCQRNTDGGLSDEINRVHHCKILFQYYPVLGSFRNCFDRIPFSDFFELRWRLKMRSYQVNVSKII